MGDNNEVSLEAAVQLEPIVRELGEHARLERALEYQVANDSELEA